MNKSILLVLAIVSVVLVAGCIDMGGGGETTTAGYGLEIIDFSADQAEIFSERSVRIFMEVENQGQAVVDNALLNLIGTIGSTTDFWQNTSALEDSFTDISPADPVREIPAEKKRTDWKLTAPTLNPGQTRTDQFIGRVYYPFRSVATGTIWVYPDVEAEAVRNAGESLDKATFTYTQAPVSIEVSLAPDPPVVETGDTEFTIFVKFTNVGGGTVFQNSTWTNYAKVPTLGSDDLNMIKINVSAPGLTVTECTDITEELIGNSLTVYCDADAGSVPATKKAYPVTVDAIYGYYKDTEISLKALGK